MSFNRSRLTREQLLAIAGRYADLPGTSLFYSGGSFDSAQKSFLCLFPIRKVSASSDTPWNLALPFSGKPYPEWTGFFSYEMGAFSDPDKSIPHFQSELPYAVFYQPSVVLEVDHQTDALHVHGDREFPLADFQEKPPQPFALRMTQKGEGKGCYIEKIHAAKELIKKGEIYQVNLSQEFLFEGCADPFQLFKTVAALNPAPFMAYIRLEDHAIISSSPERFLQKRGNVLETRPIKGTSKRGSSPEEDLQSKGELLSSPKEKAELLMITDLMRNDLGRVSLLGSVKTEKIWHLESYANVHHMISIIRSLEDPKYRPLEILRACFPGGSITGCPKLRAMEAIHQLEQRARGIYTGSIGYFTGLGDFDFNIAIRTMLWNRKEISVQLGGGIVFDSVPEKEYEETLYKGESLFHSLLTQY